MCGIVGLFARDRQLQPTLGEQFVPMLTAMTGRGPDSAGIAAYRKSSDRGLKYSLYHPDAEHDWRKLQTDVCAGPDAGARLQARGRFALVTCVAPPVEFREWLQGHAPGVRLMAAGKQLELYKDTGAPATVAERYGIARMDAECMIGHTRMATESAVNAEGSHPFTAGLDLCLVHNGSMANHNSLRRRMQRDGIRFDSLNDTEVTARFLEWRLAKQEALEDALRRLAVEFSGFFTLAIGYPGHFCVVRDPYACKPLVIAETDAYVACASEYRALAHLPDIAAARIFEPKPEGVYVWSRSTASN